MKIEPISHYQALHIYQIGQVAERQNQSKTVTHKLDKEMTEEKLRIRRMELARLYNENLGQNVDIKA